MIHLEAEHHQPSVCKMLAMLAMPETLDLPWEAVPWPRRPSPVISPLAGPWYLSGSLRLRVTTAATPL